MKLWQKDSGSVSQYIENYTVGEDRKLDLYLAHYDMLASLAHTIMLSKIGLLTIDEAVSIKKQLREINHVIESGVFSIEEGVEDVHSQIELILTDRLGELGKKIHSGRSRNDQVLVDIKLFLRSELFAIVKAVKCLFDALIKKSEEHKGDLLPGYTHFQIAMPSSFGLWFGAYGESLIEDLMPLYAAFRLANKNPLGSGAGYGSSFPLDRELTTKLLAFEGLHVNVVNAQMSRGKTELAALQAISALASTLARLAMDISVYNSQNFSFITLPENLTTGSSIMPHKKNPDVAEIMRARMNRLRALPTEVITVLTNLPSGYHRDLQLLKELVIPSVMEIKESLAMAAYMVENISVNSNLLDDPKYDLLFSVERVNKLVVEGIPFRDAYRQVAKEIDAGQYQPHRELKHTHLGSIGNLSNDLLITRMNDEIEKFEYPRIEQAEAELLKDD